MCQGSVISCNMWFSQSYRTFIVVTVVHVRCIDIRCPSHLIQSSSVLHRSRQDPVLVMKLLNCILYVTNANRKLSILSKRLMVCIIC